ncbi:MAG: TRCF domain-containing protein, partial [Rhodocyclaceae bacterium]
FGLYSEMLKRAVHSLQQGKEPDLSQPLDVTSEINLHAPALLPNDYCSDVHERLTLYKRLANCDTAEELTSLQEELVDRFGELPDQTRALLETHRLRILAKPAGIAKIDASEGQIQFHFVPNPPIDPARVIELIQKHRDFKLSGPDRLTVKRATANLRDRAAAVRDIIQQLTFKKPAKPAMATP